MERSILKDIEMFREQLENVNDEEFSQLCEMEANLLNKWYGKGYWRAQELLKEASRRFRKK